MDHQRRITRGPVPPRPTATSGIPGWLWGVVAGALGAFAIAAILRPSPEPEVAEQQTTALSSSESADIQSPDAPAPAFSESARSEVSEVPPDDDGDELESARRELELQRIRAELEELSVDRAEPTKEPPTALSDEPTVAEPPDEAVSVRDEMAAKEREWRPVFSEYQKRYRTTKREYDAAIAHLKSVQAQCNYTQVGEPNVRQRQQGVRQQGLPVSAVQSGTIDLGQGDCESVDNDLRRVENESFQTLRDIQQECYDDAIGRGVSIAKARLR